ncbi:MAG: hypothetical protein Q4E22_02675 [Coriobacteriia bacterium]|nr:hypothetical protein [Coriobacteriia bacterium]
MNIQARLEKVFSDTLDIDSSKLEQTLYDLGLAFDKEAMLQAALEDEFNIELEDQFFYTASPLKELVGIIEEKLK